MFFHNFPTSYDHRKLSYDVVWSSYDVIWSSYEKIRRTSLVNPSYDGSWVMRLAPLLCRRVGRMDRIYMNGNHGLGGINCDGYRIPLTTDILNVWSQHFSSFISVPFLHGTCVHARRAQSPIVEKIMRFRSRPSYDGNFECVTPALLYQHASILPTGRSIVLPGFWCSTHHPGVKTILSTSSYCLQLHIALKYKKYERSLKPLFTPTDIQSEGYCQGHNTLCRYPKVRFISCKNLMTLVSRVKCTKSKDHALTLWPWILTWVYHS